MYNMILKRMQKKNLNEIICEYYSKELKIHLSRKNIGWKQSWLYFLHSYQYIFMYICWVNKICKQSTIWYSSLRSSTLVLDIVKCPVRGKQDIQYMKNKSIELEEVFFQYLYCEMAKCYTKCGYWNFFSFQS